MMKNKPRSALPNRGIHSRPLLAVLLLLSAMLPAGGSATCNLCDPSTPFKDPVTGECAETPTIGGTILGPVLPGSGNLPSEPDTPTPATEPSPDFDPDFVDLTVFGLNGRWLDGGREICIQQTDQNVFASYYEQYECSHDDGTGLVDRTNEDFAGKLSGNVLTGKTNVCSRGQTDPLLNGLSIAQLSLVVSADGKKLIGTWQSTGSSTKVPITITRHTVGNCTVP